MNSPVASFRPSTLAPLLVVIVAALLACKSSSSPDGSTASSVGGSTSSGPSATNGSVGHGGNGTGTSGSVTSSTGSDTSSSSTGLPPPDGAPLVLYTDILSGPNKGGENGNGIYLSIFGKNFGSMGLGSKVKVMIGGAEVASYRSLGVSKGRPDIEQITVQIGAIGNPTPGTALPIVVSVAGVDSNADNTFMVNPGTIYFVDNVAGNDTTGVAGDFAHPYRHVQTPQLTTGGVWPKVKPGDFIVMRGTGSPWTDVGFENYFMRYRDKSGSAPTGATGSGPIAILGYPGEDVFIRGTLANGESGGCISAINGETYPMFGKWAVITNLRLDCEGYDGPISQEIHGDHWRVINNDLAASTAPTTGPNVPRMAGITGNGLASVWLGNHIHDIQGSAGECHGIYIDGDGSYDIAYNLIHDIRSGNGFQAYANGSNGSNVITNVRFHHNLVHDVSKHLINVADGSAGGFAFWDNVAYNAQYAAVRFNTVDLSGMQLFNNTFYNVVLSGNSSYGALTNDWNLPSGSLQIENNIFMPGASRQYNGGSNGVPPGVGTISHNLWFGGAGAFSIDASPITGDPMFLSAGSDFHLKSGSAAIHSGTSSVSNLVTSDYDLHTRNGAMDVGAYRAP